MKSPEQKTHANLKDHERRMTKMMKRQDKERILAEGGTEVKGND